MNTKKAAIIISGAILAAGAGGFLYWDNAYNFTSGAKGRKINSDGYYADFEKFNGTDSFELKMDKGEKLDFDCTIEKGWTEVEVLSGSESVFILSGMDNADTDYTVQENGDYTLKIKAKHAKGEINITFDENRKDKAVYNSSIGDIDIGDIND